MAMQSDRLGAEDLLLLADRIEADRDIPWRTLHQRDYAIGRQCPQSRDRDRLLCWLRGVPEKAAPDNARSAPALGERTLGWLILAGVALAGVAAMTGFLLANADGIVNVLWFLTLFVLLPGLFCLVSAAALLWSLVDGKPPGLALNPASLVVHKALPDPRYWQDFGDVVRLALLRYGQDMGIAFILGAVLAYLVILAGNDFSFVWSSTFEFSDASVLAFADGFSTPWAWLFPGATVDAQVVASSRYHPAMLEMSPEQLRSMRSWWRFLLAAMLCYVLLPRILLWFLSRYLYRVRLAAAFIRYPGADLILGRMDTAPVVSQGLSTQEPGGRHAGMTERTGVLVVSWSGAITPEEFADYPEVTGIPPTQVLPAGLSLAEDTLALERVGRGPENLVMVVVKSWEPPMSGLADFIEELAGIASCVVFLKPLPGKPLDEDVLADWKLFAGRIRNRDVQVKLLTSIHGESGGETEP